MLRELVAEKISIRDFRIIAERLVDSGFAEDQDCRYVILDDRVTIA